MFAGHPSQQPYRSIRLDKPKAKLCDFLFMDLLSIGGNLQMQVHFDSSLRPVLCPLHLLKLSGDSAHPTIPITTLTLYF